jgi:hypothetical protein
MTNHKFVGRGGVEFVMLLYYPILDRVPKGATRAVPSRSGFADMTNTPEPDCSNECTGPNRSAH